MKESPPTLIRSAYPDEAMALRDLVLSAYDDYRHVLPRPFWEAYQAAIREQMEQNTTAERIVAEAGGHLVGVVSLYMTLPAGYGSAEAARTPPAFVPEIRLLAVDPAWRGQGVGRALVEACIRRARQPPLDCTRWTSWPSHNGSTSRWASCAHRRQISLRVKVS